MWSAFNGNGAQSDLWASHTFTAPPPPAAPARPAAAVALPPSKTTRDTPSLPDGRTVCVRHSDVAVLRAAMRRLETHAPGGGGGCQCVLAHEEEYGTAALYVHSAQPLKEILDAATLASLDVQAQGCLTFQLSPPYDGRLVQDLLLLYAASQVGLNVGYVHPGTHTLVVFEDREPDAPLPDWCRTLDAFAVSLAFRKDVCPFGDLAALDPEDATILVRGRACGLTALEALRDAIRKRRDPGVHSVRLDAAAGCLHVVPDAWEGLPGARAAALAALAALGLRAAPRPSLIALATEAAPAGVRWSGEIRVAADAGQRPAAGRRIGAHALVTRALWELGLTGELKRRPGPIAFRLGGCKCLKCGQAVAKVLLQGPEAAGRVAAVALDLRRCTSLVTPREGHEAWCSVALAALLSDATGVPCQRALTDPLDLDGAEARAAEAELEHFVRSLRPSNRAIAPAAGATQLVEVGLRPEAVRCNACNDLLQWTLRGTVPGLRNLAVSARAAEVVVEYETAHTTEAEILTRLTELGYRPQVTARGRQLQPKLYDDLLAAATPPLAVVVPEALPTFGLGNGECIAICPAKLILRPTGKGPPGPEDVRDEVLIVCSYAPEAVAAALNLNALAPQRAVAAAAAAGPAETLRMFVQDPATGKVLPVEDPAWLTAELEFPFTVWYDKAVDRSRGDAAPVRLQTFRTLQAFWRIWSSIDVARLQEKDVLMLFREAVPPDLTHPANRTGGRWYTRALPTETRRRLWIGVVLSVIGQTLQDNTCNEVCGVVMSVKPGGDRVEVWVDGGYHHQLQYGHERAPLHRQIGSTMGDLLGRVLRAAAGPQRLHYWTHEAYERHRRLHSGSARRDKRKQGRLTAPATAPSTGSSSSPLPDADAVGSDGDGDDGQTE